MKSISKNIVFKDNSVFIIAEASANHGGSLKRAIGMIKEAKKEAIVTNNKEEQLVELQKTVKIFSKH